VPLIEVVEGLRFIDIATEVFFDLLGVMLGACILIQFLEHILYRLPGGSTGQHRFSMRPFRFAAFPLGRGEWNLR
jgi:hypothetical protein